MASCAKICGPSRACAVPCASPRPFSAASSSIATQRRARTVAKAYVEQSVVTAVSQQAIAFAVVLVAEAAYTRSQLLESNKGRPGVVPVAAGAGASLVSTAMISSGVPTLVTLGLVSGLVSSGAMMAYNAKRTADTTDEDIAPDWPGPKAWPAVMTLISFFAVNVFFQGLRAEL